MTDDPDAAAAASRSAGTYCGAAEGAPHVGDSTAGASAAVDPVKPAGK